MQIFFIISHTKKDIFPAAYKRSFSMSRHPASFALTLATITTSKPFFSLCSLRRYASLITRFARFLSTALPTVFEQVRPRRFTPRRFGLIYTTTFLHTVLFARLYICLYTLLSVIDSVNFISLKNLCKMSKRQEAQLLALNLR